MSGKCCHCLKAIEEHLHKSVSVAAVAGAVVVVVGAAVAVAEAAVVEVVAAGH